MMKRLVVAIVASACVMSAYAADQNPIDFNVQLAGKVPLPNVFEVKSVGWENGGEARFDIPEEWDDQMQVKKELPFLVKSSYGAIHMKAWLLSGEQKANAKDDWYLQSNDGKSRVGLLRQVSIPGKQDLIWADRDKLEIASKDHAAKGAQIKLVMTALLGDSAKIKMGVPHTGTVFAVFETDLEG
ncbi:hypothetical protein [Burkholderia orbicola]|uniref:hypothetical protein n=1 Tax=Burkholderia orbicola TaxID=2978683 RepID=UPI002FDF81C9